MKSFFEFLNEQARIFPDTPKVAQFGDDTKMKLLSRGITPPEQNPNRPVDTTGANSPFADPNVKSVSPDKPLIGKDNAVKKALAAKGYDASGKKVSQLATRSFPDQPPQQSTMKDKLNMMRMSSDAFHKKFASDMDNKQKLTSIPKEKVSATPKLQTKVSSPPDRPLSSNKSEPTKTIVPIPKARPANLVPKAPSFKQAFAAAKEGSSFEYKGKKYKRITKKG